MLIASLERLITPCGGVAYCATDPFDGEMLTRWHGTIMQVDAELEEHDKHWGLMLACHRGESDVPLVIGDDAPSESTERCGASDSTAIPCN